MTRDELNALADLEEQVADWLWDNSMDDASLICAARAEALRALAKEAPRE